MERTFDLGAYRLEAAEVEGVRLFAPEDFWFLSEREMKQRGYG